MHLAHAPLRRGVRPRRGFTLIELLVVIAIIAVLLTLTVGGVAAALAAQQERATAVTIQKVDGEIDKRMKAVISQANTEQISPQAYALAGTDSVAVQRARVIHVLLRIRQEFPMNYGEIANPPAGALPAKP